MRYLLSLIIILSALSATAQEQTRQLTMEDGGELSFKVRKPTELSGTFHRGHEFVEFTSKAEGKAEDERIEVELRDLKGEFLQIESTGVSSVTARIAGGSLVLRGEQAVSKTDRGSSRIIEGNAENIDQLVSRPGYRILPYLAIQLLRDDITGESHPAARVLHGLGIASAVAQGLVLPDLPMTFLDRIIKNPISGWCKSLRSDPYGDTCFGMCGNSCFCWWPVCNTCCGCEGCWRHDWSCRCLSDRVEKANCYTFMSFFFVPRPCATYSSKRPLPSCP
jgi:hypothetical protein